MRSQGSRDAMAGCRAYHVGAGSLNKVLNMKHYNVDHEQGIAWDGDDKRKPMGSRWQVVDLGQR